MDDRKKFIFNIYLWALSALLLIPWLSIQYEQSVNSDVAWLTICAERVISGIALSQGCFDTNPPLNIMIYIPFIFIGELLSIKTYDAIFWGTLSIIFLFVTITYRTLKYFNSFSDNERLVTSLTFLCSLTIIPSFSFAERDHFIAIALLPFILTQLCITYKHHLPQKMKYFTLIIGATALLIKPHFGLIPAFIFIHRAIKDKSIIKVMKSPDFLILSLLSIGYICIVWIFFKDFITVILPDVLRFYVGYTNPQPVYLYAKIYVIITSACLAATFFIPQEDKKKPLIALGFCALLALAVFVIQMKGFSYHRFPFYALVFPLGGLLLYDIAQRTRNVQTRIHEKILIHIFIILIFISAYIFSPLRSGYPTHRNYENNKLSEYINQNCTQPCSYFITYENMDIISQQAFYSGHTYATRFPAFWFQPAFEGLVSTTLINGYKEPIDKAKARYASYITNDIKQMNPSLLLIIRNKDGSTTDFAARFTQNYPELVDILLDYKPIGSFSLDRAFFYQDTKYDFEHIITWDVYKKDTTIKENNQQ